jgi:NAD(P)-dependent dehydrogenase (short-subunit alcohol dehydrogenase family)
MLNPLDLRGRTILVTGASSGIGRETAILLSKLGARMILVSRNEERLNQTVEQLEGSEHLIKPFDLKAFDNINTWLKSIAKEAGPLQGLVHSAGTQNIQPLRFLSSKDIENSMHLNVNSAIVLAQAFRQKGVSAAGGSIVFISSVMGLVGQPLRSIYSASKGALIALARSLALELARDKIRVNCVAPAFVKTAMLDKLQAVLTPEQFAAIEVLHPLGFGEPLDIAYAIAFLLADTGRWITGTTLVVDGGYTAQ